MRTGYEIREGSQMLAERFQKLSQCDRILSVLRDGNPHLVSEIHARAGYSRLNSRVAELRKRGYDIRSFHLAGKSGSEGYGYQLCAGEGSSPHPSGALRSEAGTDGYAGPPPATPAQMSLEAA